MLPVRGLRPGDIVRVWYGPAGFLALQLDQTFATVGETGDVIGEGHVIEHQRLTAIGE